SAADVYIVLARGGDCLERSGIFGVLRGRRSGVVHRQDGAVVHFGDHAVFVRGTGGVRRELQHVRAGGSVPRGQAIARRGPGEVQRFGADVRLHPHGADQRGDGRTVSGRADQRNLTVFSS